jgi:hypothetical protein
MRAPVDNNILFYSKKSIRKIKIKTYVYILDRLLRRGVRRSLNVPWGCFSPLSKQSIKAILRASMKH